MGFSTTDILLALSLLPAVGLMIYIYKMDRFEKEPKGLLVGLFFLGVGSTIPTMIVELLLGSGLSAMFPSVITIVEDGYEETLFVSGAQEHLYYFLDTFFCVAMVEEGFKWLFCFLITHKSKHFNCVYDAIVYMAFVSLGFAAAENVVYVFSGGIGTAVMRMLTAVPGHCAFGVIMGYFYGRWLVNKKAGMLEKQLQTNGVAPAGAPGFGSGKYLALSLIVPILFHGFYDFCAFISEGFPIYLVVFYIFIGFLFFLCFRTVHKVSNRDTFISYASMDMVLKKYPAALGYVRTMPEYVAFFFPTGELIPQPGIKNPMPGMQPVPGAVRAANPQPYAQPVQNVGPYVRPQSYPQQVQGYQSAPMPQPAANPQPYQQPIQSYQMPVTPRPYAQPVQNPRPYAQPVQNPIPYAQPVQNPQPYVQPVQNPQPYQQPVPTPQPVQQPVPNQQYAPNQQITQDPHSDNN